MKKERSGKKTLLFSILLLLVLLTVPASSERVQAATGGYFKTVGKKTYYIDSDGKKHKSWLTLKGKKYYFDKTTGVQLKGWQKDSKGRNIRYFTKGAGYMVTGFLTSSNKTTRYFDPTTGKMVRGWLTLNDKRYYFTSGSGAMVTGWLTDSKGQQRYFDKKGRMLTGAVTDTKGRTRYFSKSTGVMLTGLQKISGSYYYFAKKNGIRYEKGFGTVGNNSYYFSPKTGKAQIGWLALSGKRYYFSSKGVMYKNKTVVLDGATYSFDANGVATKKSSSNNGITFKHYDAKNNRTYTIMNEFNEHPGIADGSKTDLDLLAAVCECEAGDQGIAGMKAVALCILNRTIYKGGDFPSDVRYVIYQGTTFPQYSVVTNGTLLKRLNGLFIDRESAYKAAREAMSSFEAYLKDGTPRKVSGTKAKDFNYMYFMMTSYFWRQPLNFDKVVYETYKDHTFFEDWV